MDPVGPIVIAFTFWGAKRILDVDDGVVLIKTSDVVVAFWMPPDNETFAKDNVDVDGVYDNGPVILSANKGWPNPTSLTPTKNMAVAPLLFVTVTVE